MAEQAISLSDWLDGRVADGLDPALAGLLVDLARPCTKISAEVNRAGLADIRGVSGTTNVHGEEVKKLDLYSDQLIIDELRLAGSVCGMASEEDEDIIAPSAAGEQSDYVALFDPHTQSLAPPPTDLPWPALWLLLDHSPSHESHMGY